MKANIIKPFGIAVNDQAPESIDEFDSLGKKAGLALDLAVKYYNYHVRFSDIRDIVLHGQKENKEKNIIYIKGLEEMFGTERATKPAMKKDGTPAMKDGVPIEVYDEKEEAFFDRVVATHKINEQDITRIIQAIVNQIPFDPSMQEREPRGPTKIAQKYIDNAKGLIAGGKIEELNKRLHKQIGKTFEATGEEAKDLDTLARLVKEFAESVASQALGKLTS